MKGGTKMEKGKERGETNGDGGRGWEGRKEGKERDAT